MFEIEQFFSRLKYYHKRVPGQSFKSYTPFSLFPDFPATSLFQEFEPANFSLLTVRSVKDSEQNKIKKNNKNVLTLSRDIQMFPQWKNIRTLSHVSLYRSTN